MTLAIGIFWASAIVVAVLAFLGLVAATGPLDRLRGRIPMTRPVWNRNISDPGYQVAWVGGFYAEVYRMPMDGRWGWHVWGNRSPSVYSWQRRGSRRFRFLAVRDGLREIVRLRGGRR